MQENQRKSNLDEVVEDIKVTKNEFNEKIEQIARETEEIKDGVVNKEAIIESAGVRMYKAILETTGSILDNKEVKPLFEELAESMEEMKLTALTSLIVVSAAHAAYQGIVFYDDLLKEELNPQFDNLVAHINHDKQEIGLLKAKMTVMEKKLDELMLNIKTQNISKEINE